MKKLLLIALALVLTTSNGCRILKNKKLDKHSGEVNIKNDVAVSTAKFDSLATVAKGVYDKGKTKTKETISFKKPVPDDDIELTANFKVEGPVDLKGDTAFKLVDVKNKDVSVTVYHNKQTNELTAKIKKKGNKDRDIPFNEMLINRETVQDFSSGDTTKTNTEVNKLNRDSSDKSRKDSVYKSSNLNKSKDDKPDWKVWIGVAIIVCFFLWLGFRK
ncbi:MAG: hypothetical protein EOO20_22430 [Chryseobacterium sp.]|nr:MAG: hypothetical protein EOO20_22430 [Chryseobacterium sp.]